MYKLIKHNRLLCLDNKISFIYQKILRTKSSSADDAVNKYVSVIKLQSEKGFGDKHEECKKKIGIAERCVNGTPSYVQPYLKIMRLHKPIGSWLLFWPCSWSIALAAAPGCFPDPYLLALFGAGSVVMRGAGCTINDMWDKDIDSKVARTMDRPLVSGTINMRQAVTFLAGQLSIGLAILLQLNWYSVFLGASSLVLVVTYPLMKRVTHWPQLVLGMTFNWGILLGYSAVQGSVDWATCLPMYISATCWTIIYDTIYAHQDISDDILLGIKSTAIKFKEHTKYWLTGFSAIMTSGLTIGGIMVDQTWPYYSAVALVASHLVWQIHSLNINNPKDCATKFISNHHIGLILFCGIVLGNLLKNKQNKEQILE